MAIKKLLLLTNELSSKINHYQKINPAVSKASVGWHIEHTYIVILKITEQLRQSNPDNYKWQFNLKRTVVFSLKKIPRGKAKAPKSVEPGTATCIETLNALQKNAVQQISNLNSLDKKNYFLHPIFGNLKLSHAVKMLTLHTRHHLNIITDILKGSD